MKACPKCNTQLADDAVFCTGCGQKFEATEAQIEKVCKKCGSPLSADTQFCTKCGTPVGTISKISQQKDAIEGSSQKPSSRPPASSQSMPTMAQTPPTSMPHTGTIGTSQKTATNPTVIIGGVLVLAAIIGFLLFNSSGGGGEIPKTAEDFVSAYNREIKDIAKEKKVNVNLITLEDVPSELKDLIGLMQAGERQGTIDGKMSIKTSNNGMIVFSGAKMKNQSLQLAFQIKHTLDSDAFFTAMEGFVKASGGDVGAVMKGLGLLSGKRYNLPADYAKEFVYNNLSYKVISMGGHMTQFAVKVGNGGNSKPPATTAATNEPQKPQSAQPQKQQNAQAPATNTPSNPAYVDPMQYVTKKNQYDREISKLASDVNAYLGSHANFRNENTMLSRAENISRQIYGAKEALRIANIQNTALKNKLMEVFDALQGRADGLLDGIRASKNGGDHNPGFKRGGDAYDRFEAANEALNRML